MNKSITLVLLAICAIFFSCKKELNTDSKLFAEKASARISEELKWKGQVLVKNGTITNSLFIPDTFFIKKGYARIYINIPGFSTNKDYITKLPIKYYTTKFWFTLPSGVNIKGDSINFEAGIKNPLNSSYFNASHGRDIKLYIKGETNTASITNVATSDIDPAGLDRASISLGQVVKNNIAQLQHNTEDIDTLIMQTFNRGVVAYRNDEYLSGLAYNKEPVIGRLKEVGIEFRGSGYIDYIKIYNSVNGKLLVSEDFNTDGKSTIIIWKK